VREDCSISTIVRRSLFREFFDVRVEPTPRLPIYGKRTGAGRPRKATSGAA
jgi:hypothetical protein